MGEKLNIIQRIKRFFHLFIKKDLVLIEEKTESQTLNEKNNIEIIENKSFKEDLEVKSDKELLMLQEQYEKGEITEDNMTIFQIKQLTKLYGEQIMKLDFDIMMKNNLVSE